MKGLSFDRRLGLAAIAAGLVGSGPSGAAAKEIVATGKQAINPLAITMFSVFVVATLVITYWAAKRTQTAKDFYTAGGGITGLQNGLAIAGDSISASAFLGLTAMIFTNGFDGLIYAACFLAGWPIIIVLMAERLRNLGRFTFADVMSYRLEQTPLRIFAACGTLVVVLFYLTAQMVGAGQLIKLLFGIDYLYAEMVVGVLMVCYVTFGGMLATTWVQIIKACLLLSGASLMALLVMAHYDFNPFTLLAKAVIVSPKHEAIMTPGSFVANPVDTISLGIALMFGTAGLPHILMRFFTVPDAKQARRSVFFAVGFIAYASILIFIIGFGAITLVATNPSYVDPNTKGLIGGVNMPALWLADAVGGSLLQGFIAAVAFATILAVVSGLTLAGASAVSHDLYASVFRRGRVDERAEMKVTKATTVLLGVLAILLGIAFEKENIAFMVSLATAVAASANFPALLLSVTWPRLTTRGATFGGFAGLLCALVLTILSPSIWKLVLGHPDPIFPYNAPALFSMPLGFFCCWLFSVTDRSERAKIDLAGFEAQYIRSQTGIGAETAAVH